MGSPRRYGKAVLAIPVDSRNSWALNADAFSALAFSFAGLIPAPERIFRSIDQVCYRRLRQGVHKSTPGPTGPALPVRPLPPIRKAAHGLEVQNTVLLEFAVGIAADDDLVACLQRVLLNASPLQTQRRLPLEDVEAPVGVFDFEQRVRCH